MELHLEDIVYFELRGPDSSGRLEIAYKLVGRIEHLDENYYAEIRRAEKSPSPFSLSNLPERYKPVIVSQGENEPEVFRVPKEDILGVIVDALQDSLTFEEAKITLVGQLIELYVFDKRGKKKGVLGRVVKDPTLDPTVDIKVNGPIPKALSDLVFIEKGQKILRPNLNDPRFTWKISPIAEANRSDMKHYQKQFVNVLENLCLRLAFYRREKVSSIMNKENDFFTGFTYDNSFFSEKDHVARQLNLTPGVNFLQFCGENCEQIEPPAYKSIIYGAVYVEKDSVRNKHSRDKLIWFSASEFPGLDAFLGFTREEKLREKRILDKTRDFEGKRTIFTDILEGYFNPKASSQGFSWFRNEYLWMYSL